jgi:hypothetical protein
VKETWRRILFLNILVNGIAGAVWLDQSSLYGLLLLPLALLQAVAAFWGLRKNRLPVLRLTVWATLAVEVSGLFLRPHSDDPNTALGSVLGLIVVGFGLATLRQLSNRSARLIAAATPADVNPFIGASPPHVVRKLSHELRDLLRFEPTRALATPGALATSIAFSFGIIWLSWNLFYYRQDIIDLHDDARTSPLTNIVGTFLKSDLIGVLTRDTYPLQLFLFAALVLLTPFLSLMLASDQTANDIHSHNTRFILQRFSRPALFFGRALSSSLMWLLQVAPMTFLCSLLLGLSDPTGFGVEHVSYALWTAALISVYALPFIALMAAINTFATSGMVAFFIACGYWVLILMGEGAWGVMRSSSMDDFGPAGLLFPTSFKYWLLSAQLSQVFSAFGVFAAQAVAYLGIGWVLFKRRDV